MTPWATTSVGRSPARSSSRYEVDPRRAEGPFWTVTDGRGRRLSGPRTLVHSAHCDAVSVGGWLGGPLLRVGTGGARTVSRGTGPPNGASDWSQISAGYRLSVTAVEVVSANPYLARITTR